MNSVTITAILDEEDNNPVFEVKDTSGNATNAVTIDDAFSIARRWIKPAKSLEAMAEEWIIAHGTNVLDDMREDVETEFELTFTEDQWDSFCNMVEHATVTVIFPYGWGVQPTD